MITQERLNQRLTALEGKWLPNGLSNAEYGLDECIPKARFYILYDGSVLTTSMREGGMGAGSSVLVSRLAQKEMSMRLSDSRVFRSWQVRLAEWSGAGATNFTERFNVSAMFIDENMPVISNFERELIPNEYRLLSENLKFDLAAYHLPGGVDFAEISIPYGTLTAHGWDNRVEVSINSGGVQIVAGKSNVATFANGVGEVEILELSNSYNLKEAMAFLSYAQEAVDIGVGSHLGLLQSLPEFMRKILGLTRQGLMD